MYSLGISLGCFFQFLKFLIFGPWNPVLDSKLTKTLLGRSREGINGQVCLKFSTYVAWVNPLRCFKCQFHCALYFLTFLINAESLQEKFS